MGARVDAVLATAKEAYGSMTMAELRQIAAEHKLPTKRTKDEQVLILLGGLLDATIFLPEMIEAMRADGMATAGIGSHTRGIAGRVLPVPAVSESIRAARARETNQV